MDEETGKIMNLVFVWAEDGTELKVDVPVVFAGEDVCPGLKKGLLFWLCFVCFHISYLANILGYPVSVFLYDYGRIYGQQFDI